MPAQRTKAALGSIRIIAGQWRGRKLPVANAEGLRPTTDRNKETLFNWLMPYVQGRHCLDMFAGSGSLGLEALSRYANSCLFFELSATNANYIKKNIHTLKLPATQAQVRVGNALQLAMQCQQQFDLVFIDPPFQQGLVQQAINALDTAQVLAPNAIIYIESESGLGEYAMPPGWQRLKQKSSKQVATSLWQYQVTHV